jgi:oligosaccharide repeat unit polymerase
MNLDVREATTPGLDSAAPGTPGDQDPLGQDGASPHDDAANGTAQVRPGFGPLEWGLGAVMLVLALVAQPLEDSLEPVATIGNLLVLCNLALLAVVAIWTLRNGLPGKVLLVGGVVWLYWLEVLYMANDTPLFWFPMDAGPASFVTTPALVSRAYLYLVLFQLMLMLGYSIAPSLPALARFLESRPDSQTTSSWALRIALALAAPFPLLLASGWNPAAALQTLLASRSSGGIDYSDSLESLGPLVYLYIVGTYGAAVVLTSGIVARGARRLVALGVGGLATLIMMVLFGSRSILIFQLVPCCILLQRLFHGKLTAARQILIVGVAVLLLLGAQVQFIFRGVGFSDLSRLDAGRLLNANTAGQFSALLLALHLVPDSYDYFYEIVEPYFVAQFVPRLIWPDKPRLHSWEVFQGEFTQGTPGYNVTPSVVGQFHMNWGFLGVLWIGLWFGLLAGTTDRILARLTVGSHAVAITAIGIFYGFLVTALRFYSPTFFLYVPISWIAVLLLTRPAREAETADADTQYSVSATA